MQPFTKADVGVIRSKLVARGNSRDLALFETAISSMLRGSDLVRLTVADVTDRDGNVVPTMQTRQKKTGQPVSVHLSQNAREALAAHIARHRLTPTSSYSSVTIVPQARHRRQSPRRRIAPWSKMGRSRGLHRHIEVQRSQHAPHQGNDHLSRDA